MPPSSRSTISKAAAAKAIAVKKVNFPDPSPWRESQFLLAAIFGILGIVLCRGTILDETELSTFSTFLTGQIAWSGAMGSVLFWKLFTGFVLGAAGGYLLGHELPKAFMERSNKSARVLALVLISLVIYIPAMSAGFIWDDDQEITANPSLQSTHGLVEIWTGEKSADYFPLKTTMLWIEYQLWGQDSHGYHIVNIIVHAVDVLLLWLVLSQLRVPGAWLASLLFAIHPVHVESVAWIAERKNTLSLLFYLLSISAWLKYEDTDKQKYYVWAFLHFLAALLCKTSVVVLPAVLVLCTWWKTGTLTKRDLLRSIPFFVLSFVLAAVTVWFQNGRAIGQEVIPIGNFWSRLAGSGLAVWWYFEKSILPLDLNTIYDRWPIKPPLGPQPMQFVAGALAALTMITLPVLYWFNASIRSLGRIRLVLLTYFLTMSIAAVGFAMGPAWMQFVAVSLVLSMLLILVSLCLQSGQRDQLARTPFFVFAYFVVTLAPVLGFFKMSYMRLTLQADHFQYLSDIAIVAVLAALICKAWEIAGKGLRPIVVGGCVLLVCTFSAYSWQRAAVHLTEKTLWTACLAKNDESWQAHNHLGAVIYMEGRVREAGAHFQRAVDLKPENPEVHNNLGLYFAAFQRYDEALAQYRLAVQIKGDVPAMRRNLADCLTTLKKFDEASEQYRIILETDPNDPAAHLSYGYALVQLHHLPEALHEFEEVLRVDPNNQRAKQNREAVRQMLRLK